MDKELEYLNSLNAKRRERLCLRRTLIRAAMQWGGWLLAGLIATTNLIAQVH